MKGRCLPGYLLVVGICFWLSTPAQAQDLTVFAGGVLPGDLERDNEKIYLENGMVCGFRLGVGFVPFLGMEHTLAFSPGYLRPSNLPNGKDSRGLLYNANLIINLPTGRIVPYGTFGIGLIWQYGSGDLPVGGEFAINYGGGLKIPRRWGPFGLRFDCRGYTVPRVLSTKLNSLELSGGLLISF